MEPTNQSKADQLDEKTARIIEEMDKSLITMEKSLGPDHEVIAKILDSYAKLLRQNNIRHLDALNMEARAKHIRAKHNVEQDKSQSANLGSLKQEKKSMSVGQAKMVVYAICAVAVLGFGILTMDTFKSSKKMNSEKARKLLEEKFGKRGGESAEAGAITDVTTPADGAEANPIDEAVNKSRAEALVAYNKANYGGVPSSGGETPGGPTSTSPDSAVVDEHKVELIAKVKSFAREKVAEAMEFERNKDFQNAANTYQSVIDFTQKNISQIGQPVFTESIAKAYEGYGRMAELNNQADIKEQADKFAGDIRSHLSGSDDE